MSTSSQQIEEAIEAAGFHSRYGKKVFPFCNGKDYYQELTHPNKDVLGFVLHAWPNWQANQMFESVLSFPIGFLHGRSAPKVLASEADPEFTREIQMQLGHLVCEEYNAHLVTKWQALYGDAQFDNNPPGTPFYPPNEFLYMEWTVGSTRGFEGLARLTQDVDRFWAKMPAAQGLFTKEKWSKIYKTIKESSRHRIVKGGNTR